MLLQQPHASPQLLLARVPHGRVLSKRKDHIITDAQHETVAALNRFCHNIYLFAPAKTTHFRQHLLVSAEVREAV